MNSEPSRAERLLRSASKQSGGIARGVQEVVRALESTRNPVRAVFLASDIDFNFDRRMRRTDAIAALCHQHRIPLLDSYARKDLGMWSGLARPAAAVAILRVDSVPLLAAEVAERSAADHKTLPVLQQLVEGAGDRQALTRRLQGALDVATLPGTTADSRSRALLEMLIGCMAIANEHGVELEAEFDRWALSGVLGADRVGTGT